MAKPRLLLTGATGFVGSQISHFLGDDFETVLVARSTPSGDAGRWIAGDLRDPENCLRIVRDVRPTHLVHAAWNTEHGQFWEAADNEAWCEAGKALFAAFVETGGQRIVGLGSCAEYGGAFEAPIEEASTAQAPASLYGRSKLALCRYLEGLNLSSAWGRIFHAYGPAEHPNRLIPSIAIRLLNGEPAACSSGRQVRDFIDVRDLGRAFAGLARADLRGPINLGQGQPCTIADIATRLGALAGRPDLIRIGALPDRPGEPRQLVPELRRQRDELGFAPTWTLDQGLADALAWWRDNSSPNPQA